MALKIMAPNSVHVLPLLLLQLLVLGPLMVTSNPGTQHTQHPPQEPQVTEDQVRKELVKAQILQKLGLDEKPEVDITHRMLSKDLVLQTLRRTHDLAGAEDEQVTTRKPRKDRRGKGKKHHKPPRNEDQLQAKTSEIIAFPQIGPALNSHNLLTFSYAGNHAHGVGVSIAKANLWVKMDYQSSISRHFGRVLHPVKSIKLYVFQVSGNVTWSTIDLNATLDSEKVSLTRVATKSISLDSLGWQKLDVTSVVQEWYSNQSRHHHRFRHHHHHQQQDQAILEDEKLMLLVDCSGCGSSIAPVLTSPAGSDSPSSEESHLDALDDSTRSFSSSSSKNNSTSSNSSSKLSMPFLVLETESGPVSRRNRRRAIECGPNVKQCCKQKFYIDFRDLGWDDWIIAPKGYYANYCRGHCGGNYRTPDTYLNYHTHVLEEFRRTHPEKANLSGILPCCAPTKFSPMSLIYFGPDLNIIKRDLPKMIVDECGCP